MIILEKNLAVKEIFEKWPTLDKNQKLFVREYIKQTNPKNKKKIDEFFNKLDNKLLNEEWYNTLLDIVGWVDPTGITDAINGVIYMVQGDYLFGFLSFVAVIPYVGDLISKPIMASLKMAKPELKMVNQAMELSKLGKADEAAALLKKASGSDQQVSWFTKQINNIAPKMKQFVENIPAGPLKGFKNTILEWIQMFSKAGKEAKVVTKMTGDLATNLPKLSKANQLKNLEDLTKAIKDVKGPFRGFEGQAVGWKHFWAGMPQIFGNRSTRALMTKTKWYLGLLDWMNLGNWVGPNELTKTMTEEELMKQMQLYNATPQAKQYLQDDFGQNTITPQTQMMSAPQQIVVQPKPQENNFIQDLFQNMISGRLLAAAI